MSHTSGFVGQIEWYAFWCSVSHYYFLEKLTATIKVSVWAFLIDEVEPCDTALGMGRGSVLFCYCREVDVDWRDKARSKMRHRPFVRKLPVEAIQWLPDSQCEMSTYVSRTIIDLVLAFLSVEGENAVKIVSYSDSHVQLCSHHELRI